MVDIIPPCDPLNEHANEEDLDTKLACDLRSEGYLVLYSGSKEDVTSYILSILREDTHIQKLELRVERGDSVIENVRWNIDPKDYYIVYTKNTEFFE